MPESVKLENKKFAISLRSYGAEMVSVFSKEHNIEILWQGDARIWAGQSPLLFPVIGRLIDGKYRYEDREYHMPKHGFARHSEFDLVSSSDTSAEFELRPDQRSISIYPFKFVLRVKYSLLADGVAVSYTVSNQGQKNLYFSIGAHPGFDLNSIFGDPQSRSGVYIEFDRPQRLDRWYVGDEGVNGVDKLYLDGDSVIEVESDLFKDDAIIFKAPTATAVELRSRNCERAIRMEFDRITHLGLWGKPNDTPFVCIEPWFGIDDDIDFRGTLQQKEGIVTLEPDSRFNTEYKLILIAKSTRA